MEQEIQFFKGRIFDGEKTMEEGWVELGVDGKIVDIGEGKFPHSSPNVYGGLNFTILPGLVDAHMHFFGCRLEAKVVFLSLRLYTELRKYKQVAIDFLPK